MGSKLERKGRDDASYYDMTALASLSYKIMPQDYPSSFYTQVTLYKSVKVQSILLVFESQNLLPS